MPSGFDPRRPHHWIAFGLGAGLAPWAPGTVGTLAAIPLYLLLQSWPLWSYLMAVAAMILVGIWACGRTARDLGNPDPSAIVWDEFAGFLLCMSPAPQGWSWVLAGFVCFRVLDIWKPWPIRWVDRHVSGGLGIMLDDLVAGALGACVLVLALQWWP